MMARMVEANKPVEQAVGVQGDPSPDKHPPFVMVSLKEGIGYEVQTSLKDAHQMIAFLECGKAIIVDRIIHAALPKKPIIEKPNGFLRRTFGR